MYEALRPNGYVIVSGYDLSRAPPGVLSTPAFYRQQLASAVALAARTAQAAGGAFALGIPGAASTHEFAEYHNATSGSNVTGHPQLEYLQAALDVVTEAGLRATPDTFLGLALWGFCSSIAYPLRSDNTFWPSNPFAPPGQEAFLAAHLGAAQ